MVKIPEDDLERLKQLREAAKRADAEFSRAADAYGKLLDVVADDLESAWWSLTVRQRESDDGQDAYDWIRMLQSAATSSQMDGSAYRRWLESKLLNQ